MSTGPVWREKTKSFSGPGEKWVLDRLWFLQTLKYLIQYLTLFKILGETEMLENNEENRVVIFAMMNVVLPIAGFIPDGGGKKEMDTLQLWLDTNTDADAEVFTEMTYVSTVFYQFIRNPMNANAYNLIVETAGEILSKKDAERVQAMVERIRDAKSADSLEY